MKNYLLKSLYLALHMIKLEISIVIIMTDYSLAIVFPKFIRDTRTIKLQELDGFASDIAQFGGPPSTNA